MADVRSMLRAERASRRITHPNASYTSDGKLLCNLCEVMVKTDAAWQGHLHSTGHTLRLGRAKDAAAARGANTGNKKRKVSSLEASPNADERKRAKPTEQLVEPAVNDVQSPPPESGVASAPLQDDVDLPIQTKDLDPPADINDADLASFEQELAAMEAAGNSRAGVTNGSAASTTIVAAPMTAEEVAAKAREEQSAQRGKRDVEIEDEREDAARLMEDELEEMEGLEERVRRLREKREALRRNNVNDDRLKVDGGTAMVGVEPGLASAEAEGHEGESDEDEDYDEDDWGFGGR